MHFRIFNCVKQVRRSQSAIYELAVAAITNDFAFAQIGRLNRPRFNASLGKINTARSSSNTMSTLRKTSQISFSTPELVPEEDPNAVPMLRFEASLPKLPVPTLEETSKKYLRSIRPLVDDDQYKKTERFVAEFVKPGGFGEVLQHRLVERASTKAIDNWLDEWWSNLAYMGYRDPIIPYVSYFFAHKDDKTATGQADRAAKLTTAILAFRNLVVRFVTWRVLSRYFCIC